MLRILLLSVVLAFVFAQLPNAALIRGPGTVEPNVDKINKAAAGSPISIPLSILPASSFCQPESDTNDRTDLKDAFRQILHIISGDDTSGLPTAYSYRVYGAAWGYGNIIVIATAPTVADLSTAYSTVRRTLADPLTFNPQTIDVWMATFAVDVSNGIGNAITYSLQPLASPSEQDTRSAPVTYNTIQGLVDAIEDLLCKLTSGYTPTEASSEA